MSVFGVDEGSLGEKTIQEFSEARFSLTNSRTIFPISLGPVWLRIKLFRRMLWSNLLREHGSLLLRFATKPNWMLLCSSSRSELSSSSLLDGEGKEEATEVVTSRPAVAADPEA
ncbi:hypothetical protein E2C01_038373 [Portunus trituberculatus]|uniref:Uncharacterized protein n=1 Tax=Portunus trituberculatus TaxID=210409 RepID=A0A5B7FK10_PORTR|nr:hypothetical protein [Portunus trituberculatus]